MNDTPFLDITALRDALQREITVRLYDTLDSTNTEAKRRAAEDTSPTLYLARTQTAGRGRMGRTFHSPDTGLYLTYAYTTDTPLSKAVHITAVAAVATAQAIEALTGRALEIKWVNDLYLHGAKVAGILTEAVAVPGGSRILVGIGINITTASFPDGLRAPATALFAQDRVEEATPTFLGTLAGEIVRRLSDAAETYANSAICLSEYRRRLLYVGERVIWTQGEVRAEGIVCGVDEGYALLVDINGEVKTFSSGEISIRPV